MRIIGGRFKGRQISMPRNAGIRPTPDKVREALFNIIAHSLSGRTFLDLFAGSGAIGIEALSRGAGHVVFVDNNRRCVDVIRKNINGVPLGKAKAEIIKRDALGAINKLGDSKIRFDIAFLDPPYYGDWVKKSLIYLGNYDILKHSCLVICEHFKKDPVPERVRDLAIVRREIYGDTVLSFYGRAGGSK
jgi:16S rRNA (guanine(966)-N(2))-methyltransferase RsmD